MKRFRLLLVVVWVVLLAGLTGALLLYLTLSTKAMDREVARSVMDTLAQTEVNVKAPLESVIGLSGFLISNPVVRDVLEHPANPEQPLAIYEDYKRLSRLLSSLPTRREVSRVRFFVDDRLAYSREHDTFFGLSQAKNQGWYQAVVQKQGGAQVVVEGDLVTIYRLVGIGSPGPEDSFPILALDIPVAVFSDILAHSRLAQGNRLLLLDQDRRVIASGEPSDRGQPIEAIVGPIRGQSWEPLLAGDSAIQEVVAADRNLTLIHRQTGDPRWVILAVIDPPKQVGASSAYGALIGLTVMVLVSIGLLLSTLLVAAILNERTSRKLRELSKTIREVGTSYFDSGPPTRGELPHLEAAVQHLVETTRSLTEETFLAREREQVARFSALQAQINPHFLYNTLDTISWMARRSGASDIIDLVQALAKYFRIALSRGEEVVSIRDEVELVGSYLFVQKARFGPLFEESWDLQDNLLAFSIPKLSIQPLVENALLHGLQRRRGGHGLLKISGRLEGDLVWITVEDNGAGFSPEELERLRANLREPIAGPGFGLRNVSERLHLYFGSGRVEVTSQSGRSTAVSLVFPARPR